MKETVSERKNDPSEQEFKALCALINDETGRTFSALTRELKSLLRRSPRWKDWLAEHPEEAASPKLAQILEESQWEIIEEFFQKQMWKGTQGFELEESLCLLSTFTEPLLNPQRTIAGVLDA